MSASAFADGSSPVLLKKHSSSGFVPPQYRYSQNCEVTRDEVRLNYHGGFEAPPMVKTLPLKFEGTEIADIHELVKLIDAASVVETVRDYHGPVDGPTVVYSAYEPDASGNFTKEVILYGRYTSGMRDTNDSKAASLLQKFLDVNCPEQ